MASGAKFSEVKQTLYLFVDTETTGLRPDVHAITQIAALWVSKQGDIQDQFSTMVRPYEGATVDGYALKVQRRKHNDLFDYPSEKEACLKFQQWNGSRCGIFAGFNCQYDQSMLWALMQRTAIHTKYKLLETGPRKGPLDVMKMARELLKRGLDVENHKLVTIAKYYGVLREDAHDALVDITMTRDVWRKLLKREADIKAGRI